MKIPKMHEDAWALFSASRSLVWLGIIPVSFYSGWLGSVTFVAACSLYANVASDFAAWRADRNKEIIKRLERIEKLLRDNGPNK